MHYTTGCWGSADLLWILSFLIGNGLLLYYLPLREMLDAEFGADHLTTLLAATFYNVVTLFTPYQKARENLAARSRARAMKAFEAHLGQTEPDSLYINVRAEAKHVIESVGVRLQLEEVKRGDNITIRVVEQSDEARCYSQQFSGGFALHAPDPSIPTGGDADGESMRSWVVVIVVRLQGQPAYEHEVHLRTTRDGQLDFSPIDIWRLTEELAGPEPVSELPQVSTLDDASSTDLPPPSNADPAIAQ